MDSITDRFVERPAQSNLKNESCPFHAAVAHEIRNPLTNIILSVDALKNAEKDFDPNMCLDIIMRSSIRINELVNELIKYLPGKGDLCEEQSIHQLLDEVVGMEGDRLILKNISVMKDYSMLNYKMILDSGKMKVALTNIIINAIESMPFGDGVLKLITKSIGDQFVLQIEDNGCGISEAKLKKMFNPWFTDKPGGMGIGLKTTHDILISNHIGVNVVSIKGIGTKFILYFDKNHECKLRKANSSMMPDRNKSFLSVFASDEAEEPVAMPNVLVLPGGTGPLKEYRRKYRKKSRLFVRGERHSVA